MVTRKRASTRKSTTTRTTTSRSGRTRRRTTRTYPRRRRPGLPTTLGAALGTLVVATLLDASWPVRIVLVVAVVVAALAYVVWKNRSQIAAAGPLESPDAAHSDRPASESAATAASPDTPVNQGDSTHE